MIKKEFAIKIIQDSNIHPNIKRILIDNFDEKDEYFQFESDFMFGFIQSLGNVYTQSKPMYDVSLEDVNEFEPMCYKWCIEYFYKYLIGLTFPILTESQYVLYMPNKDISNILQEIDDIFGEVETLGLTTDYKILNKITGKLYFD